MQHEGQLKYTKTKDIEKVFFFFQEDIYSGGISIKGHKKLKRNVKIC